MIEQNSQPKTKWGSAGQILRLIHLTTAQSIRAKHRHPATGLIMEIIQTLIMAAVFVLVIGTLRGKGGVERITGGSAINGVDGILFILSGLFLYFTHNKAVQGTFGAPSVGSPLLNHRPLNSTILLIGSALGGLYSAVIAMFVILGLYHCLVRDIVFDNFIGFFLFFLLAWFSGLAVGLLFKALQPWAPQVIGIATTIYRRANMIASGKMFLANSLPGDKRAMFDWNPLFHAIDQGRSVGFLNYTARYTSWEYPLYLSLVFIMIGLLGEFYTRQNVSLSWSATR